MLYVEHAASLALDAGYISHCPHNGYIIQPLVTLATKCKHFKVHIEIFTSTYNLVLRHTLSALQ